MYKALVLTVVAIASCCELPEFNVLVSKDSNHEISIPYSKEAIRNYDNVYAEDETIRVLCSGTFSDLNLETISIQRSYIRQIEPGAFRNMTYLYSIYLGSNKITAVEDGIFDNENLEWINLIENSITKISSNAFSKLPYLKKINLEDNKLNYVDVNWFKNNPNLQSITLSRNKIAHIPTGFLKYELSHKPQLAVFFTMNPTETIDDGAFDNIDNLYLYLDETKLKKVSNMFKNITQLGGLYLDSDRVDCYSQQELNIMKIAKKVIVRKSYLPNGCFEPLQVWGKKNNVIIQDDFMPRLGTIL